MEFKDLLIKYKENYDIKDHDFKLINTLCESCFFPNDEICRRQITHEICWFFECVNCNLIIEFYDRKIHNFSRIYLNNMHDQDDSLSCNELIIKNIIK